MQKLLRIISVGILVIVSGCIPCVHPLYTEQDLIFDPALVGRWVNTNDTETWTFTKAGEASYKLTCVDKDGKQGDLDVHLVNVNDHRFLDFYPSGNKLNNQNEFYAMHLLPVHTFMRIEQLSDRLQMAFLNLDWVTKYLEENAGAIKHEKVGDAIVFTAHPKELQAFLMKHEKTPDAWEQWESVFHKE